MAYATGDIGSKLNDLAKQFGRSDIQIDSTGFGGGPQNTYGVRTKGGQTVYLPFSQDNGGQVELPDRPDLFESFFGKAPKQTPFTGSGATAIGSDGRRIQPQNPNYTGLSVEEQMRQRGNNFEGLYPAPAVVTAQPALDHIAKVNQDVTNWSSQMEGKKTAQIWNPATGKYEWGVYNPQTQAYDLPGGNTQGPSQGIQTPQGTISPDAKAVIDKIDKTLGTTPNQGQVLTPEEETIRKNTEEITSLQDSWDKMDEGFLNALQQFQNGTFPLSPEENAQISALQNIYNQNVQIQKTANANYQGALTNAGIAAGRNRYAPEIEAGNIKKAVDDGLQKVSNLEIEGAGKVAELKMALQDKDYNRIKDLYDTTTSIFDRKTKAIQTTINTARQAIKDAQTARTDFLKNSQDFGKSIAAAVFSQLGDDEKENTRIIQEAATAYGIDANILLGAIQEYDTNKQKEDYGMHSTSYKEWLDYKATGGKLDFNEYQTMDANRKAVRVSVNSGGGNFNLKQASTQMTQSINATIKANKEANGSSEKYIYPYQWQAALAEWEDAGGSRADFESRFKAYQDPYNPDY